MRHSERAILILSLVLGCVVADDGDDDEGGDDSSEAGPGGDPSGPSESGTADPSSSGPGSTDSSTTSGGGLSCGLYNTDDACTTCVIERCCDESQACADDEMCLACYELANMGDVLGEQMMGCFEYAPFDAVGDCVNDPSGCGPICSPPAGCGDYSCTYDSDCAKVGCSACTVSGTCQ